MNTWEDPGTRSQRCGPEPASHLAVVTAPDRVLLAVVEPSARAVSSQLGHYVRANAPEKLWAPDAAEVQRRLDRGQQDEAIAIYFARVGRRWDPEYLHRQRIIDRRGYL